MFKLYEGTCANALNRSRIPGMDYCLNPYTGCSHACAYCYAGCLARFNKIDERWGAYVRVKVNFAEQLARELKKPRQGTVMLASVTDAYQVMEGKYGLTRACLRLLGGTGLKPSILTKSDLVARDLDLLRDLPGAEVGFTITTLDARLAGLIEPGAPPPARRLKALERLAAAGVHTWVFVAPVIPGLTDAPPGLAALDRAARAAGSRSVEYDGFNRYPAAVAGLRQIISRHCPERLPAFNAGATRVGQGGTRQ